jgi:hypothetical protein
MQILLVARYRVGLIQQVTPCSTAASLCWKSCAQLHCFLMHFQGPVTIFCISFQENMGDSSDG